MVSDEARKVFTAIWRDNAWGSTESRSGRGSERANTEVVRAALADWLRAHPEIRTLLDAPCGDFNWMREMRFPQPIRYIGGDIVPQIVDANRLLHAAPDRAFQEFDILTSTLPQADAWLCRDVLPHLPFAAGVAVVQRFRDSNIRWFLSNTYIGADNATDITTGDWREVNLALPPYGLGPPAALLPDPAENDQKNRFLGVWHNPRLAPVTDRRLSLVTVAYRREIPFLRLQARSLARHFDPAALAEILVVGNDTDNARFAARFAAEVLAEYGALADRVRFLPLEKVIPGFWPGGGWHRQQILKLRVASLVTTPAYVVLDAKNHLIRPVTRSNFLAPDGRARSWLISFRAHFERRFRGVARLYGLDAEALADAFPPDITPAVLHRDAARALINGIEANEGRSFEDFFLGRLEDLTEFLLYNAFLAARPGGLDAAYDFGLCPVATLFPDKVENELRFDGLMWQAAQPATLFFGVHHATLSRLSPRQHGVIADFWQAQGLIADRAEAAAFLALDTEGDA